MVFKYRNYLVELDESESFPSTDPGLHVDVTAGLGCQAGVVRRSETGRGIMMADLVVLLPSADVSLLAEFATLTSWK